MPCEHRYQLCQRLYISECVLVLAGLLGLGWLRSYAVCSLLLAFFALLAHHVCVFAACDLNTYKNVRGPAECTTCPDHTITTETARTNISSCICDAGWSGPHGGPCQSNPFWVCIMFLIAYSQFVLLRLTSPPRHQVVCLALPTRHQPQAAPACSRAIAFLRLSAKLEVLAVNLCVVVFCCGEMTSLFHRRFLLVC